jgi:DNA topoisomerase-2
MPQISPNPKGEEYTKITFTPDLKRFGMSSIDDDTYALLSKRVYDMAGTVRDIKVFLNNERLKIKNFKQARRSSFLFVRQAHLPVC